MAYNDITTRSDVRVLETTQKIRDEIIQGIVQGSSILPLMTKLPNMTSSQAEMPVLNSLPDAYWVGGDTGLKQTTAMAWANKVLYAAELAVIVPIPIAVLEDSDYDIFDQYKPRIIEKFYQKIDKAIILGQDKPAKWREGLIPSIINYGSAVAPSTDSLYAQISNAMGKVEEDGFDPTALLGGVGLKKAFRNELLDTTNQPLANSEVTTLDRHFAANGAWDNTLAKFIVGDFKQAVYSIRQDMRFEIFTSGVLNDTNGAVILNLLQQDCVAMRCTMRLSWELPNPINALNDDNTTRFPFALVEPTSAPTTYNVTFTVTDSSSAAVSGAVVTFGGQQKKTNSSGAAVFKSLGKTTSDYTVKKGDKEVSGATTVATSAVSVSVVNF